MSTQRTFTYLFWVYLLALLLATLIPLSTGDTASTLNDNYTFSIRWDYLLHALVYMPLPVLMSFSKQINPNGSGKMKRKTLMKVVFFLLIFGVAFEFMQLLLPHRTFNVNDLIGNTAGIMFGCLLILAFNISRNMINLRISLNPNEKVSKMENTEKRSWLDKYDVFNNWYQSPNPTYTPFRRAGIQSIVAIRTFSHL